MADIMPGMTAGSDCYRRDGDSQCRRVTPQSFLSQTQAIVPTYGADALRLSCLANGINFRSMLMSPLFF